MQSIDTKLDNESPLPSTREEKLLADLLKANEELTDAVRVYNDIERIGVEREVEKEAEERSRKDFKLDRTVSAHQIDHMCVKVTDPDSYRSANPLHCRRRFVPTCPRFEFSSRRLFSITIPFFPTPGSSSCSPTYTPSSCIIASLYRAVHTITFDKWVSNSSPRRQSCAVIAGSTWPTASRCRHFALTFSFTDKIVTSFLHGIAQSFEEQLFRPWFQPPGFQHESLAFGTNQLHFERNT